MKIEQVLIIVALVAIAIFVARSALASSTYKKRFLSMAPPRGTADGYISPSDGSASSSAGYYDHSHSHGADCGHGAADSGAGCSDGGGGGGDGGGGS